MLRRERAPLVFTLILLAVVAGWAGWLDAKAWLAQQLIARAWDATLEQGGIHRPWSWADTWPVARLVTPDGETLYVLESSSGQALAFGPGRLAGGRDQALALAGHRDTHFAFLEGLRNGDELTLQLADGQTHIFRVSQQEVMNSQQQDLYLPANPEQLVLITCYPFDAVTPGGPLRYVVTAVKDRAAPPATAG